MRQTQGDYAILDQRDNNLWMDAGMVTVMKHTLTYLGIPCGKPFPPYPPITGEKLAAPIAALESAGVKIVIDHLGHPQGGKGVACEGFQAVLRAVERGRTWVKLSAGYRMESPEVAEACAHELVKHCGPERLLWGSDWPFAAFENKVHYSDTLAAFKRWVPDATVRRIIGGETAFRLYFT